jgi:hypothetical protein
MFPAGIAVMAKIVRDGPIEGPEPSDPVEGHQRKAPFTAAAE